MISQESDSGQLPEPISTALQRSAAFTDRESGVVVRNEVAQDLYRLMLFLSDTRPRTNNNKDAELIYRAFPAMTQFCPSLRVLTSLHEGIAARSYLEVIGDTNNGRVSNSLDSRINNALRGIQSVRASE